jgi:hypothetical protein
MEIDTLSEKGKHKNEQCPYDLVEWCEVQCACEECQRTESLWKLKWLYPKLAKE